MRSSSAQGSPGFGPDRRRQPVRNRAARSPSGVRRGHPVGHPGDPEASRGDREQAGRGDQRLQEGLRDDRRRLSGSRRARRPIDETGSEKESVRCTSLRRRSRRSNRVMAATLRELRGRIRSAGSIKKITKAQEMIATSRIGKAQAQAAASPALCRRDHPCAHHARRGVRTRPSAAGRETRAEKGRGAGGLV